MNGNFKKTLRIGGKKENAIFLCPFSKGGDKGKGKEAKEGASTSIDSIWEEKKREVGSARRKREITGWRGERKGGGEERDIRQPLGLLSHIKKRKDRE